MQIALTKKLATAIGVKPPDSSEMVDPLFVWTANWTNTFDGRKEDMLVMVNSATRFTVTIFGVKRNQFKDIAKKMKAAIYNTLCALNININVIDAYFQQAGELEFTANHDRKLTSYLNRQGLNAAILIGDAVIESRGKIKYDDTLGRLLSRGMIVNSANPADDFCPLQKMIELLSSLSDEPIYKYRAFEICVTLDLDIYPAVRRLIVPADIEFHQLHNVLQRVFQWKNCHLYDFTVLDRHKGEPVARLVANEEDLQYDEYAVPMDRHKLSEFLSKDQMIIYTYDMGDSWEHEIELLQDIQEFNKESPYLLEACGQAPPEDVGGVAGYVDFYQIMLDPLHPEYAETKEWVGYWSPELSEWESKPQAIRC